MVLRILMIIGAVLLVLDSGIVSPVTKEFSYNTQMYIASVVGVGASVTPNEINVITAELTRQKTELNAREASLRERELSIGLGGTPANYGPDYSTYILSLLLFIILVLILLNYALDYYRYRGLIQTKSA